MKNKVRVKHKEYKRVELISLGGVIAKLRTGVEILILVPIDRDYLFTQLIACNHQTTLCLSHKLCDRASTPPSPPNTQLVFITPTLPVVKSTVGSVCSMVTGDS